MTSASISYAQPRPQRAPVSEGRDKSGAKDKDSKDAGKDSKDAGKDSKDAGKDSKDSKDAGKPKVFDFTGIDLAGRLHTPQLLYFLERADEELERAFLERRSFIPNMVRSLDEEAL